MMFLVFSLRIIVDSHKQNPVAVICKCTVVAVSLYLLQGSVGRLVVL